MLYTLIVTSLISAESQLKKSVGEVEGLGNTVNENVVSVFEYSVEEDSTPSLMYSLEITPSPGPLFPVMSTSRLPSLLTSAKATEPEETPSNAAPDNSEKLPAPSLIYNFDIGTSVPVIPVRSTSRSSSLSTSAKAIELSDTGSKGAP